MESEVFLNISKIIDIHNSDNATRHTVRDPISTEALQKFHIIMTAFWLIICSTGICTNVINLRTFIKIGLDDNVTISFFFLAISDFSICSIGFVELFGFLAYVLEKEHNLWFYVPPLVPTIYMTWVRRIFNTTTILITTFIAVQRCICVVLPFHVKGMFTKFRTYVFMIVIFSVSIICSSLFASRHRLGLVMNEAWNATQIAVYVQAGSEPYLFVMEVLLGIGLNVTCQIIVMICLFVMGFALHKSVRFRRTAASTLAGANDNLKSISQNKPDDKTNVKETQAMIQVSLVSVIFVVTNSPYLGFGIANILIPEFGLYQPFHNLYYLVFNMMYTAELVNSSVNFVVYYKYNSKFRARFQRNKG